MKLNYYPPCKKPELTLGARSHYDLTSFIGSHQDCVNEFHVFVDNEWYFVTPNFNAFVVTRRHTYGYKIYTQALHNKVMYYVKIIKT